MLPFFGQNTSGKSKLESNSKNLTLTAVEFLSWSTECKLLPNSESNNFYITINLTKKQHNCIYVFFSIFLHPILLFDVLHTILYWCFAHNTISVLKNSHFFLNQLSNHISAIFSQSISASIMLLGEIADLVSHSKCLSQCL